MESRLAEIEERLSALERREWGRQTAFEALNACDANLGKVAIYPIRRMDYRRQNSAHVVGRSIFREIVDFIRHPFPQRAPVYPVDADCFEGRKPFSEDPSVLMKKHLHNKPPDNFQQGEIGGGV